MTVLAIVWARKFRTHDVVEVSRAADVYSRYYTKIMACSPGGPVSDFKAGPDGRGWHLLYDTYLEGRPVLDTLQTAASAAIALTPGRPYSAATRSSVQGLTDP